MLTHFNQDYGCIMSDQQQEKSSGRLLWTESSDMQFYNLDNNNVSMSDRPRICEGCDTVITDIYVLKVKPRSSTSDSERYWHERCLKCCMCGHPMSERCFEKEGRFYCPEDYWSLFGDRCSLCQKVIDSCELVMRPPISHHFFHIGCFHCVTCHSLLRPGDYYSINPKKGWLYCQAHTQSHTTDEHHQSANIPRHMMQGSLPGSLPYWHDEDNEDDGCSINKTDKRPRTVLTASQRRVLKSAFDLDPKPSKKARHVMAVETGLTNRVVQVWFQNQRAKMKKRQKPEYIENSSSPKLDSETNSDGTRILNSPTDRGNLSTDGESSRFGSPERSCDTCDQRKGLNSGDLISSPDSEVNNCMLERMDYDDSDISSPQNYQSSNNVGSLNEMVNQSQFCY